MMSSTVIHLWLSSIFVVFYFHGLTELKSLKKATAGSLTKNDWRRYYGHGFQHQEVKTKVVYTTSGNDNHAPCVFPFIYKGKTYTECTKDDCIHNMIWCATTSNYDKDKKWGHCLTDDDVNSCDDRHNQCGNWAMEGECVADKMFMLRVCPRSCGFCTHGGNGRGFTCVFPFFYNDEIVFDCKPFNRSTWCAVTTNYNRDKIWGYCFPKLYRDLSEVNKRYLTWGECDDLHEKCGEWAEEGECSKASTYMGRTCPWSCHKCAPAMLVKHKGCSDHSPMCKRWAKRGDCQSMPVFMNSFCRWTCRWCAKRSGLSVKADMPSCKEWARDGDCETHQEFMLQNCRQSCKTGGYVNGRICLDRVANCHDWAKKGYCHDKTCKDVMQSNCRYSCRICR